MAKTKTKRNDTSANLGFEAKLWAAADALRNNRDAAEYKHVVLGLIFLKYISDAFEANHGQLHAQRAEGADPEDPDEYRATSFFWFPKKARCSRMKANAPQPTIGTLVDDEMAAIESDNPSLKGELSKIYAPIGPDERRLDQLSNLVRDTASYGPADSAHDTSSLVSECLLLGFSIAEDKDGCQVYLPPGVVRMLDEMLAPYKGRVRDPCCASGGMFVSSEEFIEVRSGNLRDISIYGQQFTYTTWPLAKMILAIWCINAQMAPDGTCHNDRHPDLKGDFLLANSPFNITDWGDESLSDDKCCQNSAPPAGNAGLTWLGPA